ncbi:MAG TPA: YbhN family protein [Candidatus Saccharibacteria bacterium]|nr:YbhN family protein [Candidatus Saccharibacteria bacterium]HMT39322.1 YbhN family protein [Candidatus Saccharibacteria bacterium]
MKLRHFLFFIALIVIVVLAYNQFNQVQSFKDLFKTINWWILALVIPMRYLYYRFNAKYFESFFDIFKQKAKFNLVFESTITMNFVNIVFPSGGISGLSYIRKVLKDDVDSANVTLAQLSWYVLSFITYIGFLLLGFVLLLLSNQVIKVSSRLIILVLFIIITVSIALILFIFNKKFVENAAYFAVKPLNKILGLVRKRILGRNRIKNFIGQLHGSIIFLKDNRDKLGKPLVYTSLMILFDLLTIYIVFLAFGQIINPGIVIAGYVIALITSLASVVTAGVGVYEAGMVATFVGLNIPFDIAFAVTIVYRIVSLWLFIPVGLLFYKRTLLDKKD